MKFFLLEFSIESLENGSSSAINLVKRFLNDTEVLISVGYVIISVGYWQDFTIQYVSQYYGHDTILERYVSFEE